MGKRSAFEPRDKGCYDTPPGAVAPLLSVLEPATLFIEPCAGRMALADALEAGGHHCVKATDIAPRAPGVKVHDAREGGEIWGMGAEMFITNPPWPSRNIPTKTTLDIIRNLSSFLPTWCLLSWDFAANKYFGQKGIGERCVSVMPIGRVSWLENGVGGKENAAWFHFDARHSGRTELIARSVE